MLKIVNRSKGLLLLSVVLCLTACIPTRYFVKPEPVEGVITNYETGEPIPDAFVVARWTGTSGGLGHGGGAICFHVEVTKSDADGHYFIPPPEIESDYPKYREPQILITSYKPGFRRPYEFDYKLSPGDQLVEVQETTTSRVDYLSDVLKNTDCRQADGGEKNLLGVRKEIYQEVKSMENDISDKSLVSWYLMQVEQLEFGYKEAADRHSERRMQFK